ncbi:hypothetical protein Q4485_03040 [Granulosicoccaceae sp. 1_MG-2023]|nr:hypothetical protein [Granulosicoccaceae sp. 1_MG-2023]
MTAASIAAQRFLRLRSVLAYLALLAGIAVFLPFNRYIASALVVLTILLGWTNLRRVGRVILCLVLLSGLVGLVYQPAAVDKAVGNMSRIGALIITVMLLSAVLGQSDDLKRISRSLFAGNALFRYLGMTCGTALLSVPLNFGAVGVVATMIGVQVREQGDSATARNAARAVVRGFAASPMASPLSISVVMTVTLLPGLTSWQVIALGLPFALLYLFSGALVREPESARELLADDCAAAESALGPWLRFIGIIALICLGAFALTACGFVYSQAVTLSCLLAVLVGLVFRRVCDGAVAMPSLGMANNELAIMGGSSFLGGVIGSFALGWLGADFTLPVVLWPLIAMAVPWLFFLGGTLGINPIISGTLSGSILGPIWPEYGLAGLGLAMIAGWGITISGTPYSANALLLERCTGYDAREASYGWSMRFSLIMLVICSACCALLSLPW